MKKSFIYISYAVLFSLYGCALILYNESKISYTIFTLVYFLLLWSALYKPKSYSYLFLSLFLFLGIWLKLTLHLIFNYAYVEPVGNFYSLHARMDDVLVVAVIGALGILSANIIYRLLKLKSTIYIYENYIFKTPLFYNFYNTYKSYIYVFIFISTFSIVYLNIAYNIQLSGVVPTTILMYPLNAIIYWGIGVGFSVLLIILFSLDIKFNNLLELKYLILFLVIVAMTSIGLLSRGQYVFIVGSVVMFLIYNLNYLNNFTIMKLFLFIIISIILYIIVIECVTALREYYYSGALFSGASFSKISGIFRKILHLAVDRWIGLEGLMAVSSYEHKNFELFYDALTTKAQIGDIDIYQYISNAHYKDMDNTKFAFATIPGVLAFLYYSDSLFFVFFGVLVLVFAMMIIEYYIYLWYKSALLTAFIGIYLANAIAQLGLMPINFLKSMFFTFSFLLIFKLLKIKKV